MNYTKGVWKARLIPAGGWVIEANIPAPVSLFEIPKCKPNVFMSFTNDNQIACTITYERHCLHPDAFNGNNEANAFLISASPDMYESLKLYVSLCGNTAYKVDREGLQKAWELARKAINKAEGKL